MQFRFIIIFPTLHLSYIHFSLSTRASITIPSILLLNHSQSHSTTENKKGKTVFKTQASPCKFNWSMKDVTKFLMFTINPTNFCYHILSCKFPIHIYNNPIIGIHYAIFQINSINCINIPWTKTFRTYFHQYEIKSDQNWTRVTQTFIF